MRPISPTADDRIGALVEDGPVTRVDLLAVAALDALGGQLDRRQRVLDLMGDAPCHVAPCGRALGDDEIGDVVERDHVGFAHVAHLLAGNLHTQRPHSAAAHQRDLLAEIAAITHRCLGQHVIDLRGDIDQLLSEHLVGR